MNTKMYENVVEIDLENEDRIAGWRNGCLEIRYPNEGVIDRLRVPKPKWFLSSSDEPVWIKVEDVPGVALPRREIAVNSCIVRPGVRRIDHVGNDNLENMGRIALFEELDKTEKALPGFAELTVFEIFFVKGDIMPADFGTHVGVVAYHMVSMFAC